VSFCLGDQRLKDADAVIARLEAIEAWEQNALTLPMTAAGHASLEKLQRRAQDNRRATTENLAAREQEEQTRNAIKETFEAWLSAELQKAAAHISAGGALTCVAGEITIDDNHDWSVRHEYNRMYRPIGGFELRFDQVDDHFQRQHVLQIRLCEDRGPVVTVSASVGPRSVATIQSAPVRDLQLAMIPRYSGKTLNARPNKVLAKGFLGRPDLLGRTYSVQVAPANRFGRGVPQVQQAQLQRVSVSFHHELSQYVPFKASEWPGMLGKLQAALTEAIDSLIAFIDSGAGNFGP
jgi:hypothetical protein